MPSVLLISEQQRVRRLFSQVEQEGLFRLRVAPTLAQAEEEIASRLPDYVFVEIGTSNLSAAAITGLLGNLLPDWVVVVLMTRGSEDPAETIAMGGPSCLDLSETDEALKRQVRETVPQVLPAQTVVPSEPPPASPQTARGFLFGQAASNAPVGSERRLLWMVLLVMVLSSLAVIALYPREKARTAVPSDSGKTDQRVDAPPAKPSPAAVEKHPAASRPPPAPSAAARRRPAQPAPRQSAAAFGGESTGSRRSLVYVVQPGDTLLRVLMKKYGYSYREALDMVAKAHSLNNQSDLDLLTPGQTIVIPAPAEKSITPDEGRQ